MVASGIIMGKGHWKHFLCTVMTLYNWGFCLSMNHDRYNSIQEVGLTVFIKPLKFYTRFVLLKHLAENTESKPELYHT